MRAHKMSSRKKTVAIISAGVLGLATAGGAYAYWTSTGSGSGTASTRDGATVFTVGGNVANAMYPGDQAQDVTATVTNTGTENYRIAAVKAYVTTDQTGCTGDDYLLNGSAAPVDAAGAVSIGVAPVDLAPNGTTTKVFTMQFNNKANTNQDACKGAAVTIHYLAS